MTYIKNTIIYVFRVSKKRTKYNRKPVDSVHLQHAEFIKKCHLNLRLNSIEIGADEAWKNHCLDELLLKVRILFSFFFKFLSVWTNYLFKNMLVEILIKPHL